jgi:hypothetical protein
VNYAAHGISKRLVNLIVESKMITRCFFHTLCDCYHRSLAKSRDLRGEAKTMIQPTIECRTVFDTTNGAASMTLIAIRMGCMTLVGGECDADLSVEARS